MTLEILAYPDERLRRKSLEITEFTPELQRLARDMVETMYAQNGIGLAAPQVGEAVRLVVIDLSGPELRSGLMILANPRITVREGEVEDEEGCLSVPNIRTQVTRAERVTVEARHLDGTPCVIAADGLLAICLQHELDHLEGTLIVDHMSRLKRTMYDKKVRKWQKQEND